MRERRLAAWGDWGGTEMRAQGIWTTQHRAEATEAVSCLILIITETHQSFVT
jgi:hypothetical protein